MALLSAACLLRFSACLNGSFAETLIRDLGRSRATENGKCKQAQREKQMSENKNIESLVGEYCDWLRHNTTVEKIESNCVMITTPFLDRHNDAIQIYCEKRENSLFLTDDGYTLADLMRWGNIYDSPQNVQRLIHQIATGFGVMQNKGVLEVDITSTDFPKAFHSIIQAIIVISNLQGDATNEQTHNN